jgi:hypothetical protein
VATSGRSASLLTRSLNAEPPTDASLSPANGTAPTRVNLLPVVGDQGDVLLEISSRPDGPYVDASNAGGPAAGARSLRVRMRPGQTLAVTGLDVETSRDPQAGKPTTLAQVIGLGKPKSKHPEIVMLVTPELVRFGPTRPGTTLADRNASRAPREPRPTVTPKNSPAVPSQARGVAPPNAPGQDTSPGNPFTKLWRMAKRKVPFGRSSATR